jgi:hypothetical protein
MIAEQSLLGIEPVATCADAKCGWGAFYASVWGVPWFPCVPEVRSAEVDWYRPSECEVNRQYDQTNYLQFLNYTGS